MLLDFTIGNYGPFKDDVTLSMRTTKGKEHLENVLDSERRGHDAVSSAVIFGPNASGKTFIINALSTISRIVQCVDEDIPESLYTPYRLSPSCRESPVRMEMSLVLDGVLFVYSVEYKAGLITSESLHYCPNSRVARVFTRTVDGGFIGAKKRLADMTAPGRTYLATAAFGGDPLCSKVRDSIQNGFVFLSRGRELSAQDLFRSYDTAHKREIAAKALSIADLGISDLVFDPRGVFLEHDFSSPDVDGEYRSFPLGLESSGTAAMLGIIAKLADALENGKVLVIDDLGANLHPMVTRWIVKQFGNGNNLNHAQLVASSHEMGLMDIEELLRRDQIWFVNKDRKDGTSQLYCLSDFDRVRKDSDVLKMYLIGRFDAVPVVRHRGVLK